MMHRGILAHEVEQASSGRLAPKKYGSTCCECLICVNFIISKVKCREPSDKLHIHHMPVNFHKSLRKVSTSQRHCSLWVWPFALEKPITAPKNARALEGFQASLPSQVFGESRNHWRSALFPVQRCRTGSRFAKKKPQPSGSRQRNSTCVCLHLKITSRSVAYITRFSISARPSGLAQQVGRLPLGMKNAVHQVNSQSTQLFRILCSRQLPFLPFSISAFQLFAI